MSQDAAGHPFTVLVCGAGNAGQVAAALFSARYRTACLSLVAGEAERWAGKLGGDAYELTLDTGQVVCSRPDRITDDPSAAAQCRVIVMAVPSSAHGQYFEALGPHIQPGTVVAVMPARSGSDILFSSRLGGQSGRAVFVGFETLPWACCVTEWGARATILGTKGDVLAAVTPPAEAPRAIAVLQGLLGVFPRITGSPTNLGLSLRSAGAVLHPGIMYGRWCPEKWDGQPLDEKPLFYQGVEEFSEQVLLGLTGDVQRIRERLEQLVPGLDLRDAVDLRQWYLDSYQGQLADSSSLRLCMTTNAGYRGLKHPMRARDGKYVPDFMHRYLTEDVPTGLCFNKGLADILGVPTPTTDKVLAWAQDCIGWSIVVDGKLSGSDVTKTRAPQAVGITTLDAFLRASDIDRSAPLAAPTPHLAPATAAVPAPLDGEERNPFCVLVCGVGNVAQAATAMFAARYPTVALSLFEHEVARWKETLNESEYELQLDTQKSLKVRIEEITSDPSAAARANVIVMAVPSFAHGQYFEAFAPYLRPNAVVAVMPARSGCDILFASKLGQRAKDIQLCCLEASPWVCRFTEWGRRAAIVDTRRHVVAAVRPPEKSPYVFATLQGLFGVSPHLAGAPSTVGLSLRNPGALIHPGVMYGRWCPERWDGTPLAEKPLFYQGVDDFTEGVLLRLAEEVQSVRRAFEARIPGFDLTEVCGLKQWYLDSYGAKIADASSLRTCMSTNREHEGLAHPTREVDGMFVPDLLYRYLSEDVPTGLCFSKGLAEILGVATPQTDKVLSWAQECLGLRILVDGKVAGPDVPKTRAPQAHGITTFEDFCEASNIKLREPGLEVAEAEESPFTALVCGGGSAAQAATAIFAFRYRTIALSLFPGEAAKWSDALGDDFYSLTLDSGKTIRSRPDQITDDPGAAAGCDVVVLAVPSFAHGQYFTALEPHIRPGAVVACMPARSGSDILLASKLGRRARDVVFVAFETLPWACHMVEWGRQAVILGTKANMLAAVTPPTKTPKAFAALQGLLGVFPNVTRSPTNLGISLRNPGAVIHPGVMYGRWCSERWDGQPLERKPLFYKDVDDFSEGVLLGLTHEVQNIRRHIEKLVPGLDLRDAVDLKQWYMDCYEGQMTDTSSLRACMNSNLGYEGLAHPMKEAGGGFVPDLRYRYISEDVPTGMCFYRGLAEILGVPTPVTDRVLGWAQDCIGLQILVDGRMTGPDVAKTRAPQAMGISTLDAFLEAAGIDKASLASAPKMPPTVKLHPVEGEKEHPFCVLVCGGGNAAQVASAMFAARYQTIALSLFGDEAERWEAALGGAEYRLTLESKKLVGAKIDAITRDPSVAGKADAIVLAVPSFAHGHYFEAFAPYLRPNTVVAVMPARSGADVLFASKLGARARDMIFVACETLPWACKFTEWGKQAAVLGTKGSILAAVTPPERADVAFAVMQGLFGVFPNLAMSANILSISLRNPGAVIHPGMMYGRWCPDRWDGRPVAEKPLFYQGVDEFSEKVLLALTNEVQQVRKKLEALIPGLDLTDACDLKQWYIDCYGGEMADMSSLRACMRTNAGYKGLTHPMRAAAGGGYLPDLTYRYIAEDVPTGMCFYRGLAEILQVPTPETDKVLSWAQTCIGLQILEDGTMSGPDVWKTRAPQAMGIRTIEDFCRAAHIDMDGGKTFKVVFLRNGESVWNVADIFTGWADVDLSPAGVLEAEEAGRCMKENGFRFDAVYTSLLRRSVRTAWTCLTTSGNFAMPIFNSWRLNERHYGALQGFNKSVMAARHGEARVRAWCHTYDTAPPSVGLNDVRHPANDGLYRNVSQGVLPCAESLKSTFGRVLPYWLDSIAPIVLAGKSVLVVAHGNSLRAIFKLIENMSEEEVLDLNIPTGVPLVYELDGGLNFLRKYYLVDPPEVVRKIAALATQGSRNH